MPNQFIPSVKGRISEALFASLLEDVGYKVVPLGVEHSVRQLVGLREQDPDAYSGVPISLRRLPDFLVLHLAAPTRAWYVEVKFRANDAALRHPSLHAALAQQVSTWGPVWMVMFLGTPYQAGVQNNPGLANAATNSCRVFKLVPHGNHGAQFEALSNVPGLAEAGQLVPPTEAQWWHGVPLQQVFTELGGATDQTIQKATEVARSMQAALSNLP